MLFNMSKKTSIDGEQEKKFDLLLKKVKSDIDRAIKYIVNFKALKWKDSVRFKPANMLSCKTTKFCSNGCISKDACDLYREIRYFFLEYGYIIYPYAYVLDGSIIKEVKFFGFFYTDSKNVLFVNAVCFNVWLKDNPKYAAIAIAFHEFLHAISITHRVEYAILLECVDKDDFEEFKANTNFDDSLLDYYPPSENIRQIELVHRYITNNNDDSLRMLKAIYTGDIYYKPPIKLQNIYTQICNILDIIKSGIR